MIGKCKVSVRVVCAPAKTTDGDSRDSDEFYLQLQEQIDRVPGRNMAFLLGNFNAQAGTTWNRWYANIDEFNVGKENSNSSSNTILQVK